MFALRPRHRAGASRLNVWSAGRLLPGDGFVLPRWLRRPVRFLSRLGSGDMQPPRFANAVLNTLVLSGAVVYGTVAGGHMPTVVQNITARTGFAVDQIKVVGNRETSEIDVLERLELDGWTSLIGMNADAARDRIAALPWVGAVSVRKTYPNAIEVKLDERQPFAIWQRNAELTVIEPSGKIIAPYRPGRLAGLPVVVGEGAETAAAAFVAKVEQFPDVAKRATVYLRVAERRWDIEFDSGVVVKLPEFGAEQALADLEAMDRESGLLSKDISVVDMRLSDRVVVRLTPEAVERREAALKEKPKVRRAKAEKRT
ncbi:MAG: cell division protein FtsQ/DivIB [Rhizobiaceae bacterium]